MKKFDWDNSSKKLPFEVPEGYFDGFQRQMQHKIQQEPKARSVFWRQPAWRLAYAMVLFLAVSWAYNTWAPTNNNGVELADSTLKELSLENVDDDALLDYLAEEEDISTADLYHLADEVYTETSSETLIENNFLEEVDVHELDDYM